MKTAGRPYRMSSRAQAQADTRRRIAEAALQRFSEDWYEDVTLGSVAKLAGVSQQTLLNHFGSKEGLAVGASDAFDPRARAMREHARPGDLPSIVEALMDSYERTGDANARWAMTEERVPAIQPLLARGRAFHKGWIAELLQVTEEPRLTLLATTTDVLTWKMLRRDHGLSREDTAAALLDALEALT